MSLPNPSVELPEPRLKQVTGQFLDWAKPAPKWNDTRTDYPKHKCIHQLFEQQVARTPDALALVFENEQLSYLTLNAKANRLAHYLRTLNVGPGSLVGICVERGPDMTVALLGILKAGAAYVPLDLAYPKERLAFMVKDSKPVVLLVKSELVIKFADRPESVQVVCLDALPAPWTDQPDTNLNCYELGLHPEHLAYVIYTSGSTGQPKGVAMPHGVLVNLITWQLDNTQVAPTARTLQYSPISFDVSFQELFSTWCGGGVLVLLDEATRRDPWILLQYLNQKRIERLFLPFIALEQLARAAVNNGYFPDSLREIITAGEQLRITPEISDFFSGLRDCQLVNQYGPSETHVVTAFALPYRCADWETLPSIGRPIANTKIYILDAYGNPVPIGVTGELYIGGDAVARGYLGRPELTTERFLTDPFAKEPEARMYKTGDLGRWHEDGSIEFLGRNDFQVKIRGFRIELGDIEAALRQHPQLREAVVDVYEPFPGDKRLAAYLVLKKDPTPSIAELRDFIKEKMPEFMIPSAFVFLDALPITPNGKLDRKNLPSPDIREQVSNEGFISPRNPVEKQLAGIWGKILRINHIGVRDNFFELGGYSLLAIQVIIEVNKLLNISLPLSVIYQSPTIEELGLTISSGNRQPSSYSLVPIQTQGSRPPLFAIHTSLLDLPPHLGKDQPLYFLRYGMAGEINNHPIRLPLLEDLASHYIEELQQVQPRGPYYLIGYSFGGVIAYEMACQLVANGHQVNLVGLLDTCLTKGESTKLPLSWVIHKFIRQTPSQFMARVKDKIEWLLMPKELSTDFWPHTYTLGPDVVCRNAYHPKNYNGHLTLFQASELESMFYSLAPPEQAWKELIGDRLEVHHIPGEHIDICKEPHVKILAEKLIACMDKTIATIQHEEK
jgi:amino acid adenylation domain-containing protein